MTNDAVRTAGLVLLLAWAAVAIPAGAEPRDRVRLVEVPVPNLCDDFEALGDASFYACERRLFHEAVKPQREEQLEGTWFCTIAVNGPSPAYDRAIHIARHLAPASGRREAVDALLAQQIAVRIPDAKRMYRNCNCSG